MYYVGHNMASFDLWTLCTGNKNTKTGTITNKNRNNNSIVM